MPDCYSIDIVDVAKKRLESTQPNQDTRIIQALVKELEHTRGTVLAQVDTLRQRVHQLIGE